MILNWVHTLAKNEGRDPYFPNSDQKSEFNNGLIIFYYIDYFETLPISLTKLEFVFEPGMRNTEQVALSTK